MAVAAAGLAVATDDGTIGKIFLPAGLQNWGVDIPNSKG